jgi:hypothetical protein
MPLALHILHHSLPVGEVHEGVRLAPTIRALGLTGEGQSPGQRGFLVVHHKDGFLPPHGLGATERGPEPHDLCYGVLR